MAPSKQQRDSSKIAAEEFQNSNSTTAAFLGGKQKSWMTSNHNLLPRAPEASRETSHPIPALPPTEHQRPEVTPAMELASHDPGEIAEDSHNSAMFSSPGLDRGRFPVQRRKVRVDKGVSRRSNARSISGSSPASSSPASNRQTNGSARSSVTRERSSLTALPSPVPSEGLPQEGVEEVIDVARQQPQVLDFSPRRRGRPRGSKNLTSSGSSSQKRAREAASNPRKRIQCYPQTNPSISQPSIDSVEVNKRNERFKSPLSKPEMQPFAIALADRTQHVSPANGRGEYERPRLGLLQDACARSDYSYLIIHQMFCLKDLCKSLVNYGPAPRVTAKHENGLTILKNFLASNDGLCRDAIVWFSEFPQPLSFLLANPNRPMFSEAYENVLNFLARLSGHWNKVRFTCAERRFPPLVSEMLVKLALESVILQQVVFRAVLRDLWVGQQDSCYNLSEEVFSRDQQWVMYTQRLSQSSILSATQTADMATHNQSIMHEYQKIWASHAEHDRTLQSGPPPQTLLSTPDTGNTPTGPAKEGSRVSSSNNSGRYMPGSSGGYTPSSSSNMASETQQMPSATLSTPTTSSMLLTDPQSAPIVGGSRSVYTIPRHSPHQSQATNGFLTLQTALINQLPVLPDRLSSSGASTNSSSRPPGQQPLSNQSMQDSFGAIPNHLIGGPLNMMQMNTGSYHSRQAPPLITSSPNMDSHHFHRRIVRPMGADLIHGRQAVRAEEPAQHLPQLGGHQSNPSTPSFQYPPQAIPSHFGEFRRHAPSTDGFVRLPTPNSVFSLPALPNPTMTAIHQANARSPEMSLASLSQSNGITKYFRFIQRVIMPPEALSRDNCHQSQQLFFEDRDVRILATDVKGALGGPTIRNISNNSRLCRIRCLKLAETNGLPSPSEWMVMDHTWPRNIALVLNGTSLEIRRRSHHGKDLPIDVTSYIKIGRNELSIAIMGAVEGANDKYAVGLEIIQVIDYASLKAGIPTLDHAEARKRIVDQSSNTDPDVQVVRSQMVLDITDPFTSRIFDIPVRGKLCRHKQCFDLEVFLETRGSKSSHQPCSPDEFRCPICKGDVRPQSLVIDGFFASIRVELDKQGRLDAKTIILQENGEWSIKEEEEVKGETGDGSGNRTMSRLEIGGLATAGAGKAPARKGGVAHEVIELDDD